MPSLVYFYYILNVRNGHILVTIVTYFKLHSGLTNNVNIHSLWCHSHTMLLLLVQHSSSLLSTLVETHHIFNAHCRFYTHVHVCRWSHRGNYREHGLNINLSLSLFHSFPLSPQGEKHTFTLEEQPDTQGIYAISTIDDTTNEKMYLEPYQQNKQIVAVPDTQPKYIFALNTTQRAE